MKKLFTLSMLCASFFLFSQNIENKLGANGSFLIKDFNDVNLFEFRYDAIADPELLIGRTYYEVGEDLWNINLQTTTIGPLVSFSGFSNIPSGPQLVFHKSRGGTSGISSVDVDDEIGAVSFIAYTDSWRTIAQISSVVRSITGGAATSDMQFSTSNATGQTVRLTINEEGSVEIADLAGTGTANVQVDETGKLIRAASAPAIPIDNSLHRQLEHLKQENEVLRAELDELRKMVEGILEEY